MKLANFLIRHKDMTKRSIVFASTSFSLQVFPGLVYEKNISCFHISKYTYVGKRQSCISEVLTKKVYIQW